MNQAQSSEFLKGKLDFTPHRMMCYIRSRARISSNEDIEDILQNALIMVVKYFDLSHKDANLSLYCLGACNKAIAQNLERYHKMQLAKRKDKVLDKTSSQVLGKQYQTDADGNSYTVQTLQGESTISSEESGRRGFSTISLDSMFDSNEDRSSEDVIGENQGFGSSKNQILDPADKSLLNDLITQILELLPSKVHQTCFILKYVQGYRREDLISCLKMDARSIDTIDKKIVRTLKAFKENLDKEDINIIRGSKK